MNEDVLGTVACAAKVSILLFSEYFSTIRLVPSSYVGRVLIREAGTTLSPKHYVILEVERQSRHN